MLMLRKVVFAIVILAMACATVIACDCNTQSEAESFANADGVFIGKATGSIHWASRDATTFEISGWLKGQERNHVLVFSHHSDCDVSFFNGYTYIVYAKNINGELMASICSGTRVIGKLSEVTCNSVSALDNVHRSYQQIAVITASSVILSLALGVVVDAVKRRFKK